MSIKRLWIFFFILFLLFYSSIYASEKIPLDNWIYKALLKLEACGILCESELFAQKPYSRQNIASVLSKISKNKSNDEEIKNIIIKLKIEFKNELEKIQENPSISSEFSDIIVRELRFEYSNTAKSPYINRDFSNLHYISEYPAKNNFVNSKNFKGNNFFVKTRINLSASDKIWLMYEPIINRNDQDKKIKSENHEYTIGLSFENFELIFGRESISWAEGLHGSLLLSDNAPPREMIQIRNDSPYNLPWVFNKLGPMKFYGFFSKLDDERLVKDTLHSGLKMSFLPSDRFEFGFAKVVLSGGDGTVNAKNYEKPTLLEMLYDLFTTHPREVKGPNEGEDILTDTDQIWGADFRLKMYEINSIFYMEYMQEDYRSSVKDLIRSEGKDRGLLIGWYWAKPFGDYKTDFAIEFASNTPSWYKHGKYKDGYVYKNKIIGHHMGSDADDLWISINRDFAKDLSVRYSFDFERQGLRDQSVISRAFQHNMDLNYILTDHLSTNLSYSQVELKNLQHLENEPDLLNRTFGIGFLYKF
ncbi:hypothetical protein HZA55_08060 [Candidatus Poribacteria bacterium]|nr:hypothetical protein [Candidatus Poribacteria bacterium]